MSVGVKGDFLSSFRKSDMCVCVSMCMCMYVCKDCFTRFYKLMLKLTSAIIVKIMSI